MYLPYIVKVPEYPSKDILKTTVSPILTTAINEPLYSLGFTYFYHRTKDGMEITNKLPTKEPIHYVVNKFEHIIKDYKGSMEIVTKKYLSFKKDDPRILSRAFYKMWEMIFMFDLVDQKELTYAALAEGPGSFLQAVLMFRKKLSGGVKKDKYFGVTIHPEEGKFINIGKQFLNYYDERHPGLINIHKTYKIKSAAKYKSRDNGDITKVKTISLFRKDIKKSKKYAHLVTADGGFNWNDENYQEQEAYALIIGEMLAAINVQAKDGNFVLKIFDSYTKLTLKLVHILKLCYKDVYICKPLFSRESNSEKYVICKNFKYDQKKDASKLADIRAGLETVLESMNNELFLNDIYPDFNVPNELMDLFRMINITLANRQQIICNKMITFIQGNNYYGELYHNYKNEQINAIKWWISMFYPNDDKSFKKSRAEMLEQMKKLLANQKNELGKITKDLVN